MPTDRWFETSDVTSMFPTLVWRFDLKAARRDAIKSDVMALLAGLRRGAAALVAGDGWQSAPELALHARAELRPLVDCVNDATRSILRFLRIGYDAFEITGSWATILARGGAHHVHSHPNNFLSAVYYVQAESGADTINFHDPRAQTGIIRPPVVELTKENTDQVVVRIQPGTLLLFPAYLQHSVSPNTSAQERISLSFNIMFSAFTEKVSKPLW